MRYIIILALLLFQVIGSAQDREVTITKGNNYFDVGLDASDTINESETYYIEVTNQQPNAQVYDVHIDLTDVSGTPSVVVQLSGKKFADDTYVDIGTAQTWTATDFNYPIDTVKRYRFIKILFTASATEQQTLVAGVEIKTWDTGGEFASSSGTFSGNVTVGGTLGVTGATTTAAITASGLITANNGVTLGAGDDLIGSATSDITFNTNKFTVAGATGNTLVAGTLDVTGALGLTASATLGAGADLLGSSTSDITINTNKFTVAGATGNTLIAGTANVTGILTPAAGVTNPTESTHIWPVGGSVVLATAGTDAAVTDGDRYWTELMVDNNVTLTGVSYLVGSVGGTDSVVVQLCNSAGVEVATSRNPGADANIVGTTAEFQSVAFETPYAATAGVYYVALQFNGTTAKFRTYPIAGSPFVAATVGGTFGTKADITPGTTFTADKGPIFITY